MRRQWVFWLGLGVSVILLLLVFFYYRQAIPAPSAYLEGAGFEDRCPLEIGKETVVCVAEGNKLVPYDPQKRGLKEGEVVLVKGNVELLIKNRDREDRFNLVNQYQICSYTDLNPTGEAQFPQKYLASLAYHDLLLPAGIFMYCSRPALLTGSETAAIGQVPLGGADTKFLLLGVRIFPATNFRDHQGFLDALRDSFNVFQLHYSPT
jgi:hypothetical protein